jgi:hypothetical protein
MTDHVQEMTGLLHPLAGVRVALEMDGHEGDPPAGKFDLGADRHAAADARLASCRAKPASFGLEADNERTVKPDRTGHGIAVKSLQIGLIAIGEAFMFVTQAKLDELDAICELVPELAGQFRKAMPIARACHALVHFAEKGDIRLVPAQHFRYRLDMAEALHVPDGDADRAIRSLANGLGTAQLDFPERRNF